MKVGKMELVEVELADVELIDMELVDMKLGGYETDKYKKFGCIGFVWERITITEKVRMSLDLRAKVRCR